MTYDWLAAIAFAATFVLATRALHWAIFRMPRFAELRDVNKAADRPKMEKKSFREAVKASVKIGAWTNLVVVVATLPFFVSFDARPFWQHLVEIVAILVIFDFMYYWTHRSLFHGTLLRKVHALHHQARKPTHMDSNFVHPLETFLGLALFHISIPIVSLIEGAPLNTFSAATAFIIFTQLNILNHVWTKLPADSWLYRLVDYTTGVHAAHHVDMNRGNYATLSMFYDKLFGTFEEPVMRETA